MNGDAANDPAIEGSDSSVPSPDGTSNAALARGIERALLVLLIAALPLLIAPPVLIDNFVLPKLAFLIVVVGIVGGIRLYRLVRWRHPISARAVTIPAVALVGTLLIPWAASPYREWELWGDYTRYEGLLPQILFVAVAVLVADIFRRNPMVPAWSLAISAALVGSYAVVQIAGLDPVLWGGRTEDVAFSTIGNSNFTGAFLGMAIPICLSLVFVAGSRRSKTIAWILLGAIVAGCAAAHSLGGIAAGIGGGGVALALALRRPRVLALAAAGAVTLTMLVVAPIAASHLVEDPHSLLGSSVAARAEFWDAAGTMWSDNLFLGRGPDGFALEGIHYRPVANAIRYNFRFASEPHSILLWYATAAGIFGVAGFVVFVVWVVRAARAVTAPLAAGFAGAIVAYVIQSQVSINDLTIRLALWTAIGGLAATMATSELPFVGKKPFGPRLVAIPLAAALPLVLGVTAFRFVSADAAARRGLVAFRQDDFAATRRAFETALAARPHPHYRQSWGERLGSKAREAGPDGRPLIEEMKDQFAFVYEIPDVGATMVYARALYQWAVFDAEVLDECLRAYERVLSIDPRNPYIAVFASDAYIDANRPEDALRLLARYPVDLDFPTFAGALARAHAEAGNLDRARVLIEEALLRNPRDQRALAARAVLEGAESQRNRSV